MDEQLYQKMLSFFAMPVHDVFHQAVKQGLIADGWTISADPLIIQFGGVDMYIDLGAEKLRP